MTCRIFRKIKIVSTYTAFPMLPLMPEPSRLWREWTISSSTSSKIKIMSMMREHIRTNTFQVLTTPKLSAGKADHATYSYSKDIKNVYYLGQIIPNAEPETFIPIDTGGSYAHYYGKDNVSVYEGIIAIPFADPKTFKPLWYPIYEGCGPSKYSIDATHVFFERNIVPGADPTTFKALILQYGRDKNGLWFKDKLETEMPEGFEPVCNYG